MDHEMHHGSRSFVLHRSGRREAHTTKTAHRLDDVLHSEASCQCGVNHVQDSEKISADHVLTALHVPGRSLVFIDDTETEELEASPRVGLAVYAAIVLRSDGYPVIEAELLNCLARLPRGQYLHACEIVNPGNSSAWRDYPIGERKQLLVQAGKILSARARQVYFAQVRSDEYEGFFRSPDNQAARKQGTPSLPKGHKAGLRSVFPEPLLAAIGEAFPGDELVVVQDQDVGLCRLHFPSPPCRLFDSSIYCLASRDVSGLQLADLAAYSLLRAARLQSGSLKKGGPFDDVLSQIVQSLAPRTIGLWQHLEAKASTGGSSSGEDKPPPSE